MNFLLNRYFVLFAILFSLFPVQAQNLVPNPGFENYDKCPDNYLLTDRKFLIPGWYIPTGSTPDYFNSCTRIQVGVPQNYMGYCLPKEGQAYAGIIILSNPPPDSLSKVKDNYREYLEAKLTSPLEKDSTYKVSFYYNIATYSTYAVNRLGVYLSKDIVLKKVTMALPFVGVLNYFPQVAMDTSVIVTERDAWHEIAGLYKARGGETYITIGNFYSDRQTRYKLMDLSGISKFMKYKLKKNRWAYYYIDMVSVCKVE